MKRIIMIKLELKYVVHIVIIRFVKISWSDIRNPSTVKNFRILLKIEF